MEGQITQWHGRHLKHPASSNYIFVDFVGLLWGTSVPWSCFLPPTFLAMKSLSRSPSVFWEDYFATSRERPGNVQTFITIHCQSPVFFSTMNQIFVDPALQCFRGASPPKALCCSPGGITSNRCPRCCRWMAPNFIISLVPCWPKTGDATDWNQMSTSQQRDSVEVQRLAA